MTKENAINFLLYSMLGVTVGDPCCVKDCETTQDTDEDRIRAAIIRAYSDATMEGAYNTLFKGKWKELLKEPSKAAKSNAGDLIRKEIDKFFRNDSSLTDYDGWHDNLCKELKTTYEDVTDGKTPFFTYGNAQKWVNMTIKYLCLIDALSDGFIFHERLSQFQSKFHIPVDSYIIEAVLPEKKIPLPIDEKRRKQKTALNYVKSWSTWDGGKNSEYDCFQKEIKKTEAIQNSSPLDWENETWIKQSKIRKLQQKSSIRNKYAGFFKTEN